MKQRRHRMLALALISAIGLTACSDKGDNATPGASTATTGSMAGNAPATGQESSASFREFLEEAYTRDMQRYPVKATKRGIKTNNDKWDPVSDAFQQETRALNQSRL
ncbi:MAG: hypothetical protein RIC38_15550, partial [Chromatocurvus sp.]